MLMQWNYLADILVHIGFQLIMKEREEFLLALSSSSVIGRIVIIRSISVSNFSKFRIGLGLESNENGSRGRLLRRGAGGSARWQRFPRDYTRTTTMGQVVEQGGPPSSKEREKERERERVCSTVVHRFLRVIATVATTARLANPHSTGTSTRADLSKIKGGPGSMRPPRFNLSVAILSLLQSSAPLFFPTNSLTFYSLSKGAFEPRLDSDNRQIRGKEICLLFSRQNRRSLIRRLIRSVG